MRYLIVVFFFCLACKNSTPSNQNTGADTLRPVSTKQLQDSPGIHQKFWKDRLTGQKYSLPDSIGGRPVSFYLDNPKVDPVAKALYNGQFRPIDNDSTTRLLAHITTDDSIIRPFYRWALNFTIRLSDGALAEYPGEPALAYALKFPKEFLDYMNNDTTNARYGNWTAIITYSGLGNYNRKRADFEQEIISKMTAKCPACEEEEKKQIKEFAKDISSALKAN